MTVLEQVPDVIVLFHEIPRLGQDAQGLQQCAVRPLPDVKRIKNQRFTLITAVLPTVWEGQAHPQALRHGVRGHLHLDAPLVVPWEGTARLEDRLRGRFRVLHVAVSDEQAGMLSFILLSQLVQVDVRQDLLRHIEVLLQMEPP